MGRNDAEDIGGISVSIGASHSKLVSDLAAADRLLEAWAKRQVNIAIGATFAGGQGARPAAAPAVRYGAAATTGVQGQQGQSSLQAAINAQLAKTGERWDSVTNEVTKATGAIRGQRTAIMAVQEQASAPTALNIDTATLQNDLNAVLGTLREIVATAQSVGSLPAARIGVGASPSAGGSASAHERAVNTDLATRIARTTTTARRQHAPDEDEETAKKVPAEYGANFPAIQLVDQLERQRRSSREARGASPIEVNRSEQALNRQRAREEAAAARTAARQASETAKASAANQHSADRATLQALSTTAQAQGGATLLSATFAPPSTPESRAADEARRGVVQNHRTPEEERQRQARFDEAAARATGAGAQGVNPTARIEQQFDIRQQRAQIRRQVQEAQIARAQEQARITQQAQIEAAGRTPRTQASGLFGFLLGPRRGQIEAQTELTAAKAQTASATRYFNVFQDQLIANEVKATTAGDREARSLRDVNKAIREGVDYKAAQQGVSDALDAENAAAEKLEKTSTGLSVGLRSVAAVTLGGVAFAAGFKAASVVADAAAAAVGNFLDIETGFGATSTRVTSALGAQTLALHGNVAAALAAAEAQAGVSASSTAALNDQLKLTTQIKAGAQAQQQTSDLYRAGFGVGNAPSGLYGGYGGVGGTALLAQQFGGGKGFTETVQQDLSAFTQKRPKQDFLGALNLGLSYVTDPDVRTSIDKLAIQQNQKTPLQQLAASPLGNIFPGGQGAAEAGAAYLAAQSAQTPPPQNDLTQQGVAYINDLNAAAKRAAPVLGAASTAMYTFTNDAKKIADATAAAAAAGDVYGVSLAQQGFIVTDTAGKVVGAGEAAAQAGADYQTAIQQFAVGKGITDPAVLAQESLAAETQRQLESAASLDTIRSQQAYVEPSQFAAIGRQGGYARGAQLPAGLGLQGLAQPLIPVTANIAPQDVGGASQGIGEAQAAQDALNAKYKEGQQIIEDTYRPSLVQAFGEAAGVAFDTALAAVRSTGSQIADIQTKISKAQTGYETAQYNFQLLIAKRNLSDIGGLINKNLGAGESYYGQLERQNLLLGRQSQLLQFELSQRQINFQTAVAGFQAPGLTDEERQARIAEAKIEAAYAQKQLDLQKQQYRNQIKLIDIGNLRQASDLWNQTFGPSGLVAGHALQVRVRLLDTTAKDLQQIQAQNVAVLNSYLGQVDQAVGIKFGQMQALEAAYGKIIFTITNDTLTGVGNYLGALTTEINSYVGALGGGAPRRLSGAHHAAGGAFELSGPTRIGESGIAGEAGNETLLILAHPRAASGGGGATGGLTINFNAPIGVRSNDDIRSIARAVEDIFNAKAARLGLRSLSSATS